MKTNKQTINKILYVLILFLILMVTGCKHLIEEPYKFHETITVLPKGTDGTVGTDGVYVYFGDWPQTIKADDVTIDEDESIIMGSNIYYKGSDGNYYVKCLENASCENIQYSNNVPVLSKDFNSYKYFKVEPIKWRVVDSDFDHDLNSATGGKKLLVAETILTGNINFYDYDNKMRLNDEQKEKYEKAKASGALKLAGDLVIDIIKNAGTIYPNNYKHSKIRAFLNGICYEIRPNDAIEQSISYIYKDKGFLQTAFTDKAQAFIEITTVDNSKDTAVTKMDNYIDYSCENTYDKVFLLSYKEILNKNYNLTYNGNSHFSTSGFDTYERISLLTDYAKANYVWEKNNAGMFFYRTPVYRNSTYKDYLNVYFSNHERIDSFYGVLAIIKSHRLWNDYDYVETHVGSDKYNQIGIVPAIAVDF